MSPEEISKLIVLGLLNKARNRFFLSVFKTKDCWFWLSSVDKDGYGVIFFFGKQEKSHRVSLIIEGRDFDHKDVICHSCDTTNCVNPFHLSPSTQRENCAETILRGRNNTGWAEKSHCIHGHSFSGDNLYISKTTGQRMCRKCRANRSLEKYYRKKRTQ